MHELAERMLDLNRPRDPTLRECDVMAVAQEVAGFVRAGRAAGPLEIVVSGARETRAAIAPDALKQVLLNIVQNARDALEDSGRIELSITPQDSKVVLEVSDDGPGIAPDVLPKLFDPFFTTKARVQGVGLGLFVAEGILSGFGGRIEAENRDPGPGACFRIELHAADTDAAVGEQRSGRLARPQAGGISATDGDG
jgi:C4-dicarboxylate-specific signal transduction histidine kinase